MAMETKNLGLYLEDNSGTKFKEWRDKMNGPTGSNMEKIDDAVASKQDKLTGTQGQVVGFDANGSAVAQAAPDTGVTTFNGRTGAVTPQSGDYTAAQVGARPVTWTPTASDVGAVPTTRKVNNKALSEDISLTAADVGAAATNHGTHVSYSTIAPKVDGTATAGTASSVARSDHVHPTDTSRAAADHSHSNYVPTTRKINNKVLSADVTLTASDVGAAASSHGTHVTFSTTAPKAAGTAAVGSASSVARSDHVHPAQTSVSGNAGTATKLATSRTIQTNLSSTSSVSFDGSANVTPGVTGILCNGQAYL